MKDLQENLTIKEVTIKSINKKINLIDIETHRDNKKPKIKINKLEIKFTFLTSLSHNKKIAVIISEKL